MKHPKLPFWYTSLWYLALPFVAAYLLWRSLRQSAYRRHWAERFLGSAPSRGREHVGKVIWIHAVSVGETRAAGPLIRQLVQEYPDAYLVLTHMTPTGRAAGAEVLVGLEDRSEQRYLPYDLPSAIRRFFRQTGVDIGVLMETEIWPNLLQQARLAKLPVLLVNARLSEKSLRKAYRQKNLMAIAAASLRAVGAQTQADADRLGQFFSGAVTVTGNLKFDVLPDEDLQVLGRHWRARWHQKFGPVTRPRPVWLFASTREGEEALILQAWRQWCRHVLVPSGLPRPILLFVPRHPQRFDEVAKQLEATGPCLRRSRWQLAFDDTDSEAITVLPGRGRVGSGPDFMLGDSMGEMPMYYAMADVALIGGSLLPLGGQNLIEACACGCPVICGPHMFNFAQAAADAIQAGAAVGVRDATEALQAMSLISRQVEDQMRMAQSARDFASSHRGATERTVALIVSVLGVG